MVGKVVLGMFLAVGPVSFGADGDPVDAETVYGPVRGVEEYGVNVFKGIPFAKPPVGELRWAAPVVPEVWSNRLVCTNFSPSCPQVYMEWVSPTNGTDEDCLYLNVWSKKGATNRPVMVWLYGGGFYAGGSSLPSYDGTFLALKDVVVVSFNYRLGVLGFLMTDELFAREGASVGNAGLLDQILALEWVRDNIAAFGGDPDNVTLFGHSAGAASVSHMLVAEQAKGLFDKVICQSGSVPSNPFECDSGSWTNAMAKGQALMDTLSVSSLDELRAVPSSNVVEAAEFLLNNYWLHFGPMMDGQLVRSDFRTLFAGDEFLVSEVPLLTGVTGNDGLGAGLPVSNVATYAAWAADCFKTSAATVLAAYPATNDAEAVAMQAYAGTLAVFAEPHRLLARALRDAGQPVYFYQWDYLQPTVECELYGAYHSVELPYVFNNMMLEPTFTNRDYVLADQISDYWVNFATSGDPNGTGLTAWPQFGSNETALVVDTNAGYSTVSDWNAAELDFFSSVYPRKEYDGPLQYTNTIALASAEIEALMISNDIPGCSVVLVESQRVVWAEGFGYADYEAGEPVTTNTVMMIGSVSKLLTAMLALQGMDEGAFDLDASITNYVDDFSMLPRFAGQTDGWTLRTLLDHHSGIPEEFSNGMSLQEFWPGYPADLIDYLQTDYPSIEPRRIAKYCNNGFVVAGEAVAQMDGTSFVASAEARLFGPLGMDYSSFRPDKATITSNLSMSYSDGVKQPVMVGSITAEGGAFSRPLDMAEIIKALLGDGAAGTNVVLSTNAMAQLGTFTPGGLDVSSSMQPGLGLDTVNDPVMNYAGRAWNKSGAVSGFLSLLEVLPDQQLGVFVNLNACVGGMEHKILYAILTNAVAEKSGLYPPAPTPAPSPAETNWSQAQLEAVEGYYVTDGAVDLFTAEVDGSLTWVRNAQSDEPIITTNMRPHVGNRFFAPGANVWQLILTNRAGEDIIVSELYSGTTTIDLYGSRFDPPAIPAAWSNRCGTPWLAENLRYDSLQLYEAGYFALQFAVENGVLMLGGMRKAVLAPTNDVLAFQAGYLTRGDSCVRIVTNAAGQERLLYSGYRCMRYEDIPVVTNGAQVVLSENSNALLRYESDWLHPGELATLSMGSNAPNASLRVISLDSQEMIAQGTGQVQWYSDSPVVISISGADSVTSDISFTACNYAGTIANSRAVISNLMAEHNIPGCSVALVDGQTVVWAEGFGYADVATQKPVTTNTVMMIGSVSKLLTTLMALQLVDDGTFDLDDGITNYVSEFSMLSRFTNQVDGWTIRSMLDHHSGLPGDIYNGAVSGADYWSGYTQWLIEYFQQDYPLYPPNRIASYCNSGFNVVGEAIARHDGKEYTDAAETRIFTPLEMPYSSFLLNKATVVSNLATGYNADGSPALPMVLNMPATGGAFSRPLDMANIIKMLLDNGQFDGNEYLSTNALVQMGTAADAPLDVDSFFQPGLGLDTVDDPVMHYAGRAWMKDGSTGTFGALLEVMPDKQLGVFVNLNCASEYKYEMVRTILKQAILERDRTLGGVGCSFIDIRNPASPTYDQLLPYEGYYVTKRGVDHFMATSNGVLSCVRNVQTNSIAVRYRVYSAILSNNYKFVADDLTNCWNTCEWKSNDFIMIRYGSDGSERDELIYGGSNECVKQLHGTRYNPPVISAAWSNRCGTFWLADNLRYDDYSMMAGEPSGWLLSASNGILSIEGNGLAVLAPTNDRLAFVAGYSSRGDSAVQIETNAAGQERLWFGSYRCVRMEDIPSLTNLAVVELSLSMHTNAMFTYGDSAAGQTAALVLGSNAQDVVISVFSLDTLSVIASGTGSVEWVCETEPCIISIRSPEAKDMRGRLVPTQELREAMRTTLALYPRVPGFMTAIQEPGMLPLVVAEGYARIDPPSTNGSAALVGNEHFRIASISKFYTATAIMLLRDRGLLHLTNTVAELAPELKAPRGGEITVELLLAHRSGLPDANNTPWIDDKLNANRFQEFTVEEIVAVASNMYPNLMFEPGTDYHYTDTGYNILARIIENVSGTNYQAFMRSDVLTPLGLTNTFVPDNDDYDVPAPVMHAYATVDGVYDDWTRYSLSAELGCGSVITDVAELMRFASLALHSTNLLSAESRTLMMTPLSQTGSDTWYGRGAQWKDGFGWGHGGDMWGMNSYVAVDTNNGVCVAAVNNGMEYDDVQKLFNAIFALYSAMGVAKDMLGYEAGDYYGSKPPVIINTQPSGRAGAAQAFTILNGNFVTNWTASNLPPGMMIEAASGVITGTPSVTGLYEVVLVAENSRGFATNTLTYTVAPGYTNTIAQMTDFLNGAQVSNEFVGMSVVLVDEDGIVWSEGFGWADHAGSVAASADTVYRIGSVSKLFSTVSALRECDRGRLALDAAITNYVPDFMPEPRLDTNLPPIDYEANPITVRSLLNHLSGIPSTYMRHAMTTRSTWIGVYPDYLSEMMVGILNDYSGMPVDFYASYNNNGFQVAEYLIQQTADASYANYAHSNLFLALGMSRSGMDMDAQALSNTLAESFFDDLSAASKEYVNCLGSGGALSTANDMGAFLGMLLNAGEGPYAPVLQPGTVTEMMSPQTEHATLNPGTKFFAPGLGWDTIVLPEFGYAGGGCSKNGETTTFAAYAAIATNQQLAVFAAKNSPNAGGPTEAAQRLLRLAIEEKTGLTPTNSAVLPESPFVLAAQTNVDALAGYYVNDSGYAKLRAGTNCLLYGGSALYLREDGWWSETNEPPFLMGFTNFAARRFVRLRMVYNGYLETMLVGQQYEPPALPDVWSNRVDTTWLVASLPDVSYMRAHPGTLSVRLWQTNGLLMLSVPSIYLDNYSRGYFSHTDMVIEPYDDGMAFVQGAGGKMPCSVRCDDSSIFVNSYFWMNTEEIPHLASGATTNFAPYPLMTDWFAFNAQAGVEYFLNLGGAVTGIVMLADANGDYLGDGSQGAMLRWTCPSSGVYYAGINFPMDAPDEVEVSVYNYSNTIAHMQSWFQTQIDQTNAVGISVALVDDQEVVWAEGFGYANLAEGKPVTTNTVFHIGSVSKTFTSATALQYLDKGTLDLDTAFTNYIPEVSWKARYPSADDITVRDLLAMYSGLPGDLIRGGFLTVPQDVGYQNVTNDLAADYPIYPPQFTWSYCNTAFILMQGIIENLANTGTTVRPFTQIADDSLFTPLDMEGTSYIKDKPVISNELAVAYRGTEAMPEEYISLYGTGSMYSRPIDLCRFMAMINRAGGGYLSSNTLEVMTTAQGTNTPFAHLYFFDTGLGWDMVRHPALNYAGRMCNKNGGTITFSAMMEMLLDHKLGVAVSVSSRSTIPDVSAIETLRYALYDKTGIHWPTNEVSLLAPTQTVSAASLEALEGYYANAGGLDHVVADTNALTLTYIGNLELGGSPVSNLVLRTNGVFVSDDVPVMGYIFTNVAGYDVVQNRIKLDDTTLINVMHAVRLTNMPVISAAWLARTGQTWFAQNINPYSYLPLENTTPELKLQVVEGILCAVSGGLVADAVLRPHNDTLAFVEGLTIRGDSSVKVIESGSEEYLLIGGYMFGPQPMDATFDTNVTGSIANAGFAHWYRVETAVPDAVNGVSNLYYEITGSRMPDNFLIRLYEDYGTTLVDQQTGSGTLGFNADTMPLYLSVQPDITGTQTGDYQLAFSYPLLLRQIQTVSNRLVVTWQGKSNTVATLETAADLAATNAFVPAITNLTAPGMLNAVTNDVGPDPYRFYRIMEGAAAYSNRYGRVVFISDQHMSPFASSFIVGQLLASDVSVWDTILQSATNGYYTRDATGYHVTTPMMYNSALVNAAAACPQPDAVIMPGDLATYSFRSNYQKVTGDYEEENWKRLLTKMIEYTLYRANETFPGVPIYCALGNGDSFAGDYDIDVGGAFLMTSAPVFFNYGLSNVTDYMSFCATYTNEGNYCAPFAAGEMITLETTFMSKNYPGSLEYGSNQLAYLEARLQACRDAGKPAWVLQHIPPGVSAYGTWSHWKTGDTTHVSCDLHEAFIESYNQIIADYRDTVKTIICGHYHERGWQIANDPATSNATVGIQVMNGLLFNHGNNSGFTVMTYDRETLEPVREYSYNLPQSYAGKTGAASWNLRFSENQGFGIDDLSAASLLTAWSNMTDVGSAGYNYFNRQYSGGRQPYLMSSNSWPVYHGVIRWIERDQFLNNVHK